MPTPQELEAKFWTALDSDRTVMLGLVGGADGALRPMAAQLADDRRAIWFFTSTETVLAAATGDSHPAQLAFVSKGHDLFATVQGQLARDRDRSTIDRLWNRHVAAWFDGGKDDPRLALLRFEPEQGEIWEDASSVLAGIKMLLGTDPKADAREKVARIDFR